MLCCAVLYPSDIERSLLKVSTPVVLTSVVVRFRASYGMGWDGMGWDGMGCDRIDKYNYSTLLI